jgi:hypothetical protein
MPSAANTPPKLIRVISNPRVAPWATILGTFGALLRKNESKTVIISPIVSGVLGSLTEFQLDMCVLFDILTRLARERSVRSPNVHRTFAPRVRELIARSSSSSIQLGLKFLCAYKTSSSVAFVLTAFS